jgi:hypothetical protein
MTEFKCIDITSLSDRKILLSILLNSLNRQYPFINPFINPKENFLKRDNDIVLKVVEQKKDIVLKVVEQKKDIVLKVVEQKKDIVLKVVEQKKDIVLKVFQEEEVLAAVQHKAYTKLARNARKQETKTLNERFHRTNKSQYYNTNALKQRYQKKY